MPRIEDYALIGDPQTAALVGRDGSIDWCCFPRFDSGACFAALLGDREHGRWRIAPAGADPRRRRAATAATRWCSRPVFETDERQRAGDRLHAAARRGARHGAHRRRAWTARCRCSSELVIRFDYGRIVPWVRRRRPRAVAVAGPDALCFRTPVPTRGAGLTTVRDFTRAPGRPRAVRARLVPVAPAGAGADRRRARRSRTPRSAGASGPRGAATRALPGRGPRVAAHAQGAHLRADRRHRGRADHLAAGAARRRAQLGLPVLLAARRDVHPARDARRRLHRGGGGLARVAAARGRGRPGRPADHVRHRRRAAPGRVRAGVAAGLRGLAAGAGRQRRLRAAAARRLRRGDGRALSGARPTARRRRRPRGRCSARCSSWLEESWRKHGRGHLGGARARAGTSRTRR